MHYSDVFLAFLPYFCYPASLPRSSVATPATLLPLSVAITTVKVDCFEPQN